MAKQKCCLLQEILYMITHYVADKSLHMWYYIIAYNVHSYMVIPVHNNTQGGSKTTSRGGTQINNRVWSMHEIFGHAPFTKLCCETWLHCKNKRVVLILLRLPEIKTISMYSSIIMDGHEKHRYPHTSATLGYNTWWSKPIHAHTIILYYTTSLNVIHVHACLCV